MSQELVSCNEKTMKPGEVARNLKVTSRTVTRWAKEGIIPPEFYEQSCGLRGRLRFDPAVIDFLKSRYPGKQPPENQAAA